MRYDAAMNPRPVLRVALAAAAALALSAPDVVRADPCVERLEHLGALLDDQARRARMWNWGWTLTFTAASAGQFAAAPLVDDLAQKRSFYVGGAKAAIGVGSALIRWIPTPRAPEAGDDACAAVAEAERALARLARAQRGGVSWMRHAEGVALNVGGLLVLGVGYDHWREAVISTVGGLVVGEIRLLTHPRGAMRGERGGWTLGPLWEPGALGLSVAGQF
jgi:hypothetical protein